MFPIGFFPITLPASNNVVVPTGGSLFRQLMDDAGWAQLFDTSGESVVYIERGGVETQLIGLVANASRKERRHPERGTIVLHSRHVTILANPASDYGGVVRPQLNATMQVAGLEWSIADVEAEGNGAHKLTIERTENREIARSGYRGGN
jgi:hypothetical protein